jgi:hypothetical protein
MPALRSEERWAAAMVSAALGVQVRQHDDGSRDGMHDLDAMLPDGPAAVEVTACADGEAIETWNLMNGGDGFWTIPGLAQQWTVVVLPTARIKLLARHLPALLAEAERDGLCAVEDLLSGFGVVRASAFQGDHPGRTYLTISLPSERSGGAVPQTGDHIAVWAGDWLRERGQIDVLTKLAKSGAAERHVFAFVTGLTPAPFGVQYLLMVDDPPLPTIAPALPDEVTHLWVCGTWSTPAGLRWSALGGWQRFDKVTTIDKA